VSETAGAWTAEKGLETHQRECREGIGLQFWTEAILYLPGYNEYMCIYKKN
jgi:hypothetical protein